MPETILAPRDISRAIERAIRFLGVMSLSPPIRRVVASAGYDEEAHREGWDLALRVMGYTAPPPPPDAGRAPEQERAVAELDQMDGPMISRIRSALGRLHPDQGDYVLAGVVPGTGMAAVANVRILLDRVTAPRQGTDPDRARSREADRAAAATLARRNIVTETTDRRLRDLIATATAVAPLPVDVPTESTDSYQASARALIAWLADWRETARGRDPPRLPDPPRPRDPAQSPGRLPRGRGRRRRRRRPRGPADLIHREIAPHRPDCTSARLFGRSETISAGPLISPRRTQVVRVLHAKTRALPPATRSP